MIHGIAIAGLNGSGKSTLAHALAKQTGYYEMDVEDYYFPEQKASRRQVLENDLVICTDHSGALPFSHPRTKSEVQAAIIEEIRIHPEFILSGVAMNWSAEVLAHINIAFWIQTPLMERLHRIQSREEKRFGARVLAGGDMFAQQIKFRKTAEGRDPKSVQESLKQIGCTVIEIDGTLPVTDNLKKMTDHLSISCSPDALFADADLASEQKG